MRQSLMLLWTHTNTWVFLQLHTPNPTPNAPLPSSISPSAIPIKKKRSLFYFCGTPFYFIFFWEILIIIWSKGGIAEGYWYDLSHALFCYQPSLVRFLLFFYVDHLESSRTWVWFFSVFWLLFFWGLWGIKKLFFGGFCSVRFCCRTA